MLLGCEVLTRKGLQRKALASFHTLSMQLYYIFALRSVGKMSGSRCGTRKGILSEFLKCSGGEIKCKCGAFPSARLKKIYRIPKSDFYLTSCYSALVLDTVRDVSSFPFLDRNHSVCFTYGSTTGARCTWEMLFSVVGHDLHLSQPAHLSFSP